VRLFENEEQLENRSGERADSFYLVLLQLLSMHMPEAYGNGGCTGVGQRIFTTRPCTRSSVKNVASARGRVDLRYGRCLEDRKCSATRIVVNDVLYVTTPKLRVLALNAANGSLSGVSIRMKGRSPGKESTAADLLGRGRKQDIFFCFRHFICALDAKTGR